MFCRKCGKEINDDAKFCPFCGMYLAEEENYNIPVLNKVSFKESIKALFEKLFVFKGTTGQREFNFGLLFLFMVSCALTTIVIMPEISNITDKILESNNMADMSWMEDYLNSLISKDIFHFSNLSTIGTSLIFSIFLVAPIYRRMADTGKSKAFATAAAILFVVSQLACSGVLYCLLPDAIYESIGFVLSILSIINTAILVMCIFGRSQYSV